MLVYTVSNSSLNLEEVPEMMVTEWKVFFNQYSIYSQNQQNCMQHQEASTGTWKKVLGYNSPIKPGAAYNFADFLSELSIV